MPFTGKRSVNGALAPVIRQQVEECNRYAEKNAGEGHLLCENKQDDANDDEIGVVRSELVL